jgi:hypothetical protein
VFEDEVFSGGGGGVEGGHLSGEEEALLAERLGGDVLELLEGVEEQGEAVAGAGCFDVGDGRALEVGVDEGGERLVGGLNGGVLKFGEGAEKKLLERVLFGVKRGVLVEHDADGEQEERSGVVGGERGVKGAGDEGLGR